MGYHPGVYERLARLVARRRRAVLATVGLLVVAGLALTPVFQSRLLGVGYDTQGTESHRGERLVEQRTGVSERITLVVSTERRDRAGAPLRRALGAATAAVRDVDRDLRVIGPDEGGGEVSRDGRLVTATVALTGDAAKRQDDSADLQDAVRDAVPPGFDAGVTGDSPLLADLIRVEEHDMLKAELVGLPIALVILLVAFGSIVAASLPLLLGLSGLFVSFGAIAGVMLLMDFNSFAESLMAMVGLAVGIDYSLLVVRRWREERAQGDDPTEAMVRTLTTAGRTVTFSGAILATALLPLVVTNLPFFGDTAFAVITVVLVEVVLTLTLLPAILLTLGDRIDRLTLVRRRPRRSEEPAGWQRWARGVMRRPVPVLVVGVALLLLAAAPASGLTTGVDLNARAMQDEPSVKTLGRLERAAPGAALAPVDVVLRGGPAALARERTRVEQVLRADARLGDVRAVPVGGGTVLVSATPTVGVDTPQAERLVRDLRVRLRTGATPGAEALVTGVTAETVDFTDRTNDVAPWVVASALLLAFVLLMAVFRSPLLAAKAILMNLLSIAAALGLTVLVFQHGHGEQVFDFSSPGYLQSWMPLTLFMMLFGLSMDYEVFMVSRIREEWGRSRDTTDAVARGLAHTGGVVTSAAAIMVAIFASFTLTSIPEMKQMGFALAAAVLIDATLVRALLVPAFMRVAGRWNWWIPRRLDRLLPRLEH